MSEDSHRFAEIGSVNSFAEREGLDPRSPQALGEFTAALTLLHRSTAAEEPFDSSIPLQGEEVSPDPYAYSRLPIRGMGAPG